MPRSEFRLEAFATELNSVRLAKDLTWKEVAEQSGVSASTLTRLSQGKRPDVDSLATLVRWSGLKADNYMANPSRSEGVEPLAQITSALYSDRSLTKGDREAMLDIISATYRRFRVRGRAKS